MLFNRLFFVVYLITASLTFVYSITVIAHEDEPSESGIQYNEQGLSPVKADSHAPIGVMAEHTHKQGEWMLSYRFKFMHMQDILIDDSEVSPDKIVTTILNRFFGIPMQPPTLRVVPTEMQMYMHMFGGMYAPTDWLTLMVMGMYMEKSMDHITYAGGMGTTRLGTFNTKSDGFGDTRVTGMFELLHRGMHRVQLNAGLSLPTGSITETDDILTPLGTTPTVRLPYPMQLGSGTFDFLPGIVYVGTIDHLRTGVQYAGTIRIGENDENYSLGNKHLFTAWTSYAWKDWLSTSIRIEFEHEGKIDGIDPFIVAPVQTADPNNQGGNTFSLLFGINLAGQHGALRNHRMALEAGFPVHQNLNGPQLSTEAAITVGWQYAF